MAGQNGYLTSAFDGSIPNVEFGEAVAEGDLVGFRDDAGGRRLAFKALAAAGGTQIKAVGICPRDVVAGGFEAIRLDLWRIAFPVTLPAALSGIQPGDPVYLSDATAGAMTKTAPVGVGKISQVVGYAYYTSNERRGMPASADANGMVVSIMPAVAL